MSKKKVFRIVEIYFLEYHRKILGRFSLLLAIGQNKAQFWPISTGSILPILPSGDVMTRGRPPDVILKRKGIIRASKRATRKIRQLPEVKDIGPQSWCSAHLRPILVTPWNQKYGETKKWPPT